MKRGPKGSPVCESLQALLMSPCPKEFFPWVVTVGSKSRYCYARTRLDALKKVMSHIAEVSPCTVEEIIRASKSKDQGPV